MSELPLKTALAGIIEIAETTLNLRGFELSKDNFASHKWKIFNDGEKVKLFHCHTCDLVCGLSVDTDKLVILAMKNISCDELKFYNLLK